MSTRQDRKTWMTAAAALGTEPHAPAPGETAVRTKPDRITAGLSPATCTARRRWLASTAVDVGKPKLTSSGAVRAMTGEAIAGTAATTVLSRLRQDRD